VVVVAVISTDMTTGPGRILDRSTLVGSYRKKFLLGKRRIENGDGKQYLVVRQGPYRPDVHGGIYDKLFELWELGCVVVSDELRIGG
jgi:hypothetical protein